MSTDAVIILLNGPINAGKTTVAREITALLPNTAHVEVDVLGEFVPFLSLAEAIPINLENAAAVTLNLVRRGFNVVLTYPLGQADHDELLAALADLATPIHTVTLGPELAVSLSDRGGRPLSEHERRRIAEQYADGRHDPPFGIRVDNSTYTPNETAAKVLDHVRMRQEAD